MEKQKDQMQIAEYKHDEQLRLVKNELEIQQELLRKQNQPIEIL